VFVFVADSSTHFQNSEQLSSDRTHGGGSEGSRRKRSERSGRVAIMLLHRGRSHNDNITKRLIFIEFVSREKVFIQLQQRQQPPSSLSTLFLTNT